MSLIQEAEGVYRLPLYTSFPVGPINVYVLVGDRLALFDSGIALDRTWQELTAGLAELGRQPDDVDLVVISHAHIDHQGLAHRFPNAEVRCGRGDLAAVLDVSLQASLHLRAVQRLMGPWGIPEDEREELARAADFSAWKGSVPWALPLDDGERLEGFGPSLRALAMPGHTRGLLNLFREDDGILLSSDHLLPTITPNPDLYTHSAPIRSGLPDYISSLRRLLTLDVRLVLPGHGKPFPFTLAKVREMLDHHETRLDEVRAAAGPGRTVADITDRLFGQRDPMNRYLALREAFGHLEILLMRGRVEMQAGGNGSGDLFRAV